MSPAFILVQDLHCGIRVLGSAVAPELEEIWEVKLVTFDIIFSCLWNRNTVGSNGGGRGTVSVLRHYGCG